MTFALRLAETLFFVAANGFFVATEFAVEEVSKRRIARLPATPLERGTKLQPGSGREA
jgi:CBS domain containing-hemolysin-like protein